MYNDEGTSSGSRLLPRSSSSLTPGASEIVLDEELGFTEETVEMDTFQAASKLAPECRPPSLFDNYEVIGGVPAFAFKASRSSFTGHLYSVSSDGIYMVVATENRLICIYDLSDGCSLVAEKTHIAESDVLYVSFWNDRNDQIVIINRGGFVFFYSLEKRPCMSSTSKIFEGMTAYKLVVKHRLNIDKPKSDNFDVFDKGSVLWFAFPNNIHPFRLIYMIRVTEEGSTEVSYFDDAPEEIYGKRVHMGKNYAIVTPTKTTPGKENTYVISILDYESKKTWKSPLISGILVGWDRETNYFLIWRIQNDNHMLDLYSMDDMKHKSFRPIVSLELGKELFSVKAAFLDRNVWMFNNFDKTNDVDLPLICVVSFKSSISILSVWDTHSDKILKQMDVTIDEMKTSDHLDIVFSVSKDMHWFTLGSLNDIGIVAMFSFSSEVMVWSVDLELDVLHPYNFSPPHFDALSSRLIICDERTIYVFVPPCLVKGFDLKLKCCDAVINASEEQKIMNMTECHARLFSQYTLLPLFVQIDDLSVDFLSKVRVAIPCCTSEFAIMLLKERSFSIIFASLDDVFSTTFRNLMYESSIGHRMYHTLREIKLNKEHDENLLEREAPFYLFLYPNNERTNDEIVIFWLYQQFMKANFVSLDGATQELVCFEQTGVLSCFQSNDRLRIICLKKNEILIIELERRKIICRVEYQVDLPFLLYSFCRDMEYDIGEMDYNNDELVQRWVGIISLTISHPDVSYDGRAILLGWKCDEKKPLLLTPNTQNQELEQLSNQEQTIMPCWVLDDNFEKFSFIEYEKDLKSITHIGIYCQRDKQCKSFRIDDWTLQHDKIFEKLNFNEILTLDLKFDNKNGTLWVKVLSLDMNDKFRLSCLPLTPYLSRYSLPYLYNVDSLSIPYRSDNLDRITSQFSNSFLNMPYNGMTNLHLAIKREDMDMIRALLNCADKHNIKLGAIYKQGNTPKGMSNVLKLAISQESEELVKVIFNLFEKKQVPFSSAAYIMRKSLQSLWKTNRVMFNAILSNDCIAWKIHSPYIPSKILEEYKPFKAYVGLLDDHMTLMRKTDEDVAMDICRSSKLNSKHKAEQSIASTKINTIMKIYCIEDICNIGSRGIIRFFLTQGAPAHLFKTPLLKWTILWKWEYMWKRNSWWSLVYFLLMLGVFTIYVVCFSLYKAKLKDDLSVQVWLTFTLAFLVVITIYMWFQEVKEIKTYIKDGKELFPNMRYGGIRYYLSSGWNILESITYFLLLFVIAPLHFASFLTTSHIPILSTILAMESILMWFKIWYYAQAFTKTGAFVLMIENVIRDCTPFLMLSGIIFVGFSLALFTLFQQSLHQENSNKRDVEEVGWESTLDKIDASFSTPIMAMLTLFYAMIGTFDVEIYSNSGNLSPLIVFVFVLYLSIQAIVMFNMLIAIMSDTFDRVKSTEEEQLLMGRARFIDACEAALSEKQIKAMEKNIGKYLYVVLPKVQDSHNEKDLWKGRVKSMEDNVRSIAAKLQAEMIEVMKNNRSMLEGTIQSDIKTLEKSMKNDICVLEEAIQSEVKNIKCEVKALGESINDNVANLQKDINLLKIKFESSSN